MEKKKCLQCNKEFEPKGNRAKFCSDACKMKYYRAKEEADDQYDKETFVQPEPNHKPKKAPSQTGNMVIRASMLDDPADMSHDERACIHAWQGYLREFKTIIMDNPEPKLIEKELDSLSTRVSSDNRLTPAQVSGIIDRVRYYRAGEYGKTKSESNISYGKHLKGGKSDDKKGL